MRCYEWIWIESGSFKAPALLRILMKLVHGQTMWIEMNDIFQDNPNSFIAA